MAVCVAVRPSRTTCTKRRRKAWCLTSGEAACASYTLLCPMLMAGGGRPQPALLSQFRLCTDGDDSCPRRVQLCTSGLIVMAASSLLSQVRLYMSDRLEKWSRSQGHGMVVLMVVNSGGVGGGEQWWWWWW